MIDDNSRHGTVPPAAASPADVDRALDRLLDAIRVHLGAVRAAEGEHDDDAVWEAYLVLRDASHHYDQMLDTVYGEVTPWDLEETSPDEHPDSLLRLTSVDEGTGTDDPHPKVISVRQRRDYRIPSVSALLRSAEEGREQPAGGEVPEPITSVGDAVLELLHAGDGSLAMLDVPELDPLDGVVVVAEVGRPYNVEEVASEVTGGTGAPPGPDVMDPEGPFRLRGADQLLARLDERALPDLEA